MQRQVQHILPAAEYGYSVYLCARFYDTEGKVHYSEVSVYSPEAYAKIAVDKSTNEKLTELVKYMVTYGEYTRKLFNR